MIDVDPIKAPAEDRRQAIASGTRDDVRIAAPRIEQITITVPAWDRTRGDNG
ncbi:hypothetical protein FHX44_112758 [Pseudonocardia hierapolitana]|uniref:Uncharacterized protein n=1 Tax=Pseudonocardia hierapolitana TaxID=1128676 RepID=A0A561SPR2_9PSEU|nr:hypothetical protein [Pseudonocardia hierapolitana]TWF76860.1 hypothetical protein FHX44_112758 [Pseudonocardia hierapolitana]